MKLAHILSLACVLAAAGCSSTSDTGTDGGTTGDTGVSGDTGTTTDSGGGGDTPTDTGGQTCAACVSANCSDKVTACNGDTQCKADIDCINACNGSASCDNNCISNECGADGGTTCPPSDDLFNALITCAQASCTTPCFGKT